MVAEHHIQQAVRSEDDAVRTVFGDFGFEFDERADAFQHAIADFNRQNNLSPEDALILKVGVHSGPCLSVTQNDLLDYFGTTVNMAARIAGLSKGGDIIVSKAMLEDDEVRDALVSGGFGVRDSMLVALRGLPDQTEVCNLVPIAQLQSPGESAPALLQPA